MHEVDLSKVRSFVDGPAPEILVELGEDDAKGDGDRRIGPLSASVGFEKAVDADRPEGAGSVSEKQTPPWRG
jgi:hypothetical protein